MSVLLSDVSGLHVDQHYGFLSTPERYSSYDDYESDFNVLDSLNARRAVDATWRSSAQVGDHLILDKPSYKNLIHVVSFTYSHMPPNLVQNGMSVM